MSSAPANLFMQTGVAGLDDVLGGGLIPNRLYLLEGDPGSGKTTLALQFLLEGVKRGESCLYVTLAESEEELRASATSHGWVLDGIHVLEIIASQESLMPDARYTMFHPSEVELSETIREVLNEVERLKPTRIVVDSLSELRLLAESPLRYRRQILGLKQYFSHQQSTVLLIDDRSGEKRDTHLHSLAHGVISLENMTAEYGTFRRQLLIRKLRGRAFREGLHDFALHHGGIKLFPRLIAAEHRQTNARDDIKSGLDELDAMLGGGLTQGTSTLFLGAAGTGKSWLATQYATTAALRGEHVSIFLFDETLNTFLQRSASLGMQIDAHIRAGLIRVQQIDPAELSPGEFAHIVRQAVEANGASLVVIDSLNGYLNAMPSDRYLILHMHELLTYLGQKGVTTLLLMAQYGIIGDIRSPIDASYLADTVLLLRYFEAFGEVRKALSVIKKRTGRHEHTVRELYCDNGMRMGPPLKNYRGVLHGIAQYIDPALKSDLDPHE